MAGFREFLTGEVLSAANVNNFLMKQSVMVFADDAARTAALGAEVAEGMLTYNEDTAQLEVFDGTNFVAAAPEPVGIGSNVVSARKTNTFTTTSTTFVLVTDLSIDIVPSSATAKILLFWSVPFQISGGTGLPIAQGSIFRSTTNLVNPDSLGARTAGVGAINVTGFTFAANTLLTHSGHILDSPATTSSVNYNFKVKRIDRNTLHVNRTETDTDGDSLMRSVATITAIEVAA